MRTRIVLGVALPLATAVLLLVWLGRGPGPPNVLLVTIDTLRADHLGVYGYGRPTSPNIDRFAARSVVFENAFAQASSSAPGHASLLTGLHVPRHGAVANGVALRETVVTLAEVLRAAGYETAMYVTHPLVASGSGLERGFDVAKTHLIRTHDHPHAGSPGPPHRLAGERRFLDMFLDWLTRKRERPFFAWLHLQHVHESYEPPAPFDRMFLDPPATAHDLRCVYTIDAHAKRTIDLTPQELDYVIALYDGEVAYADELLGEILRRLEQAGRIGDTIVVLTADHGEMLFDDPDRRQQGHERYLLDPVLHIPLILRAPGVKPGRIAAMVRQIDVMPTVLDLAGLAIPAGLDGRSARDVLRGTAERGVPAESFSFAMRGEGVQFALRTADSESICERDGEQTRCRFFDLAADPRETTPIDETADPRALALRERLGSWYDSVSRGDERERADRRNPRVREMLRRAGYLKDGKTP